VSGSVSVAYSGSLYSRSEVGIQHRKGELASLLSEPTFKRAFGENKNNLCAFLNSIYNGKTEQIAEIDKVEQPSNNSVNMRYDIFCTLCNGDQVIIEVQKPPYQAEIASFMIGDVLCNYSQQRKKSPSGHDGLLMDVDSPVCHVLS